MKNSESLSSFLAFTRAVTTEFDATSKELELKQKETQDILHQFEFGLAKDRPKFATQLAKVRRERRVLKNYFEVNETLVNYLKDPEFVKVYRRLEQLLGDIRKKEKQIESQRSYRPRVYKNLPITQTEETT